MSYIILSLVVMSLLSMLKGYRAQKAFIQHLPRHCIFRDATIMEIIKEKPHSVEDLMKIKGIGTEKAKQFGADIIGMIKGFQLSKNKSVVVRHDTRNSRSSSSCSSRRGVKSVKTDLEVKKKPDVKKVDNSTVRNNNSKKLTPPKTDVDMVDARNPHEVIAQVIMAMKTPKVVMNHSHMGKPDNFQVYILELEKGKVYVGKTTDLKRRLAQHQSGIGGSEWTKLYKPTGRPLPRLGTVYGDGDCAEMDETIRYMYKLGIDNVRGWRYVQPVLTKDDKKEAEHFIREKFDLCRKCGFPGHFIKHCRFQQDRHGHKI